MADGVFDTYENLIGTDGSNIREDLSDRIWDVSPSDTPMASAIPKSRASSTNNEWQRDELNAPAHAPAVEGADAPADGSGPAERLGNYAQIITKSAIVSGSNEAVDAAGRNSEMAYQIARRMEEIKTNIEFSMTGRTIAAGQIKVAGDDTTARQMGAIQAYLVKGYTSAGDAVFAAPITNDGLNAATPATNPGIIPETVFQTLLELMFNNGSKATMVICDSTTKTTISSTYDGGTTRYNTADDKKLVTSIDVYAGDYHTLEIAPSRIINASDVLVIDPEYLALAELRPMFDKELGDTGDSWKRQVIWEGTLQVRDEGAHGIIQDSTGAGA